MPENVSLLKILPLSLTDPEIPSFECGVPEEVSHREPDPCNTSTT